MPDPDAPPAPPPSAVAVLDVHAMDIWGQYLPDDAELIVSRDEAEVTRLGFPISRVPLYDTGEYRVELSAPEHDPLEVTVYFDGRDVSIIDNPGAGSAGVALGHGFDRVPVHSLYLGLRHRWFAASGRPARRGNRLTFLMDGEEAWAAVKRDLQAARHSILLASWFFE